MTRIELLQLVVAQARSHGFGLRRWWTRDLGFAWHGAEPTVEYLARGRHYYMLLFAHDFAQSFWRGGTEMVLQVEAQNYQRVRPDGSVIAVSRKGYVRRRIREDAWRYHLREMSTSEEPLRYIRRFLRVQETLEDAQAQTPAILVDAEDQLPED